MNIKNKVEILKAKKYSDIFSDDTETAKKQLREYCKLYHPDVNDSKEASELFCIVQELYNNKHRAFAGSGTVTEDITIKDKKTGKGFVLSNTISFNNGIAMVYHTATKVAMIYDKSYKKFYEQYLKNVKDLEYVNSDMRKEFERYFPKVVKNFETEEGQFCILLDKTQDVVSLGRIVKNYETKGEEFPERQAAWILNRLYNIACYMNYYKKVFNGFSLDNLWVSPDMHTVLQFSGWEYSTKINESMIGCPKDVYKILPIKVKDNKKSQTITDLESIKSIGRRLFKGKKLDYINKFLSAGTSDDIFQEWDNYRKTIKEQFGKSEFIIWEDVPY
jgi:hypothetical protein